MNRRVSNPQPDRNSEIKPVELIVLGGGLAGCTLAWRAHLMGWSVAILDRLDTFSSTRVAAGLVTPITGGRGAASWRWNEFFSNAHSFYQHIEVLTERSFWNSAPAIHVYQSHEECELYTKRWLEDSAHQERFAIDVSQADQLTAPGFHVPFGMCKMQPAARLDTVAYLQATREYFEASQSFYAADVDAVRDIVIQPTGRVDIPRFQLSGSRIAFCQGFAARENQYFSGLPMHPARGDILTIECCDVDTELILHGEAWVVPTKEHRFLVGATYDRSSLHHLVDGNSDASRLKLELMTRWEKMVEPEIGKCDYQVVDHRAAVRPASYDRHPLIGTHDHYPNVYCLNGLGSKGSLMAPRLAEILINAMQGDAIEPCLLWNRRK